MRYLVGFLGLALLIGCAGDPTTSKPAPDIQSPIVGSWVLQLPAAACALGLRFDPDGHHEDIVLCILDDGTSALQKSTGTFSVSGTQLLIDYVESTCPGFPRMSAGVFTVRGATLALPTSTGELVYARASGMPSGSGGFTYGCYDSNAQFSPSPLAPL